MVYAIIKSGKREYKATPGKVLVYYQLDAEPGDSVVFDQVSRVVNDDHVIHGEPLIEGASVHARVIKHEKEKGIIVFRLNRRMLFHRKNKHRLTFTRLRIEEIIVGDESFNKSSANPRKIRQAQANARREAVAKQPDREIAQPVHGLVDQELTASVIKPVGSVTDSVEPVIDPAGSVVDSTESTIESVGTVIEKETRSVDYNPRYISQTNSRKSRIWMVIIALLLLCVLFYAWNQDSSSPIQDEAVIEEMHEPADVDLRTTRSVDSFSAPMQPPD
ncbi:MAG: 50S ribosomal protein L21 [Gammaproteobacteria bacterium]|nr:50S ribosomal protein L21 [Gammaproteobacteria bacterium]